MVIVDGHDRATDTSATSGSVGSLTVSGERSVYDDEHSVLLTAEVRDERFEPVFIRRVVDLDDKRAVVNLTLRSRG